jgi:hypothetical protein
MPLPVPCTCSNLSHHTRSHRVVAQVRPQPTFDFIDRHALTARVILNLILSDFANPEILRIRMAKI